MNFMATNLGFQTAPLSSFRKFGTESDFFGNGTVDLLFAPKSEQDVAGIAAVLADEIAAKAGGGFVRAFFALDAFSGPFDFTGFFNPVVQAFITSGGRFDMGFAPNFEFGGSFGEAPFFGFEESGNFAFLTSQAASR